MLNKKNYFITVEGIEGAGKSTVVKFIQQWLVAKNIPHLVTREPGGTPIAEEIRQLLLFHHLEKMYSDTELLLMFAGRAQHLAMKIKPALAEGKWVICDRFTDASYAYQGGGRGIDYQRIAILENWVQGELRPDLTLLLDLPVTLGFERIKQRCLQDRIEKEKIYFFERVRDAYLERAKQNPERYRIIHAHLELSDVCRQIEQSLQEILAKEAHE